MRKFVFLAALAAALLAARGTARAEVAEGDIPGEFSVKDAASFVNSAPCSFKTLRGHAVLVEIFQTW